MRKILLYLFVGIFVVACDKSSLAKLDVDIVKNGVMDNYKSLTVGGAFDNWKGCNKGTQNWSQLHTDNGALVVQFRCGGNVSEFEQAHNYWISHNDSLGKLFDVKAVQYEFQWVVNKDDSFELDAANMVIHWDDGRSGSLILSHQRLLDPTLTAIYKNNFLFTLDGLINDRLGFAGISEINLLGVAYNAEK